MYNILIVDDEPLALRGITAGVDFSKLGFHSVCTALNSEEAKLQFAQKHFDLLLCDIEMPGDSGLDLAQWVNDHYPGTVIIFLTAHADFSYAQDAVRLMAFRYLLKPISYPELEQILSQALQRLPSIQSTSEDCSHTEYSDSDLAIKQTVSYIRANLQKPLSRESLGKNVFLNPNYLARIFKEKKGISLVSYITDLRLETACHLLHSTNLAISEICEQVGINDCSYFAKIFKRKYGISPKQYRENK